MSPSRIQAGFTLVEVVVAITVLSLVMVLTVAAMRSLGGTQASLQQVVDRVDEIRSASSFLRENLETAVIGWNADELTLGGGATETTFFRIRGNSMEWKSRVLFGENYGGSYFLRLAHEEGSLVLRWQEPGDSDVPGSWRGSASRVLLESVESFRVFIRERAGEDWRAPEEYRRPPQLVRFEIQSRGRFWPDLIMPVQR